MNKFDHLKIGILGAGSWGTALASYFASILPNDVYLWARDEKICSEINHHKTNSKYLPNIKLGDIYTSSDINEVAKNCDIILVVVPSNTAMDVLSTITLSQKHKVIFCTKGVLSDPPHLLTEIFKEKYNLPVAVLSGPNFASEIAMGLPACSTIASDDKFFMKFSEAISSSKYKFIYSDDIVSPQIIGTTKNILAIGCGILSGLEMGQNAIASFFYYGIEDIIKLCNKMGGNPDSIISPAGIGDLFLTCSSNKSRNFSFGYKLAREKNIDNMSITGLSEGYINAKAIYDICNNNGIDCKIFNLLYSILYENQNPEMILKWL